MKKIHKIIEIDNSQVPIEIICEMRMDVRCSIANDKAIMRVPIFFSRFQIDKNLKWAKSWLTKAIKNNENIKNRFIPREYKSGDVLEINGKSFALNINEDNVKNFNGRIIENNIIIKVPLNTDVVNRQKGIKVIQSRLVGNYFAQEIRERIEAINKKYFNVRINSVKLKYNKSNWGSRSSKDNINISTRLLFAPKDVQDYVFVHELAHFFEMNHSPKFWNIVRQIIPDYKEKEKWLKTNNHKCDF